MKIIFAERLKQIIELRGITRNELANKFVDDNGEPIISKNRIDKWCSPYTEQMPATCTLIKLAKHLDTSVDYLCGISDVNAPINIAAIGKTYGLHPKALNNIKELNEMRKEFDLFRIISPIHSCDTQMRALNTLLAYNHANFVDYLSRMFYAPFEKKTYVVKGGSLEIEVDEYKRYCDDFVEYMTKCREHFYNGGTV
jgi:transcriptional regulator with XRE-family HTH domain